MNKTYCFKIDKRLKEKLSAPIRSFYDIATVLIETLQYLTYQIPSEEGDMKIVVHKMKRIFYIFPEEIFTFSFPFTLKYDDEAVQIYDGSALLDNKCLSALVVALRKIKEMGTLSECPIDLFEEIGFDFLPTEMSTLKTALVKILTNEYGYLRYDIDKKRERGDLHPYYHLDINYSQSSTYKMGLPRKITFEWLQNLLDTTTPCKFIKI